MVEATVVGSTRSIVGRAESVSAPPATASVPATWTLALVLAFGWFAAPLASNCAGRPLVPPVRCSRYSWAFRLSGKAGKLDGTSAPFCTSISAMGNAIAFTVGGSDLGDDDDDDDNGNGVETDAGSAATRARKTACVLRERSATFGLAPRASP